MDQFLSDTEGQVGWCVRSVRHLTGDSQSYGKVGVSGVQGVSQEIGQGLRGEVGVSWRCPKLGCNRMPLYPGIHLVASMCEGDTMTMSLLLPEILSIGKLMGYGCTSTL